ncbi:hypothetical protein D3C75_278260 [compost metagenome]
MIPVPVVGQLGIRGSSQIIHFQIVQQLGIVRCIAVYRLYLQIVEPDMIVAAGQINPAGQFRSRIGISRQLLSVQISGHCGSGNLDSKVMPGIISRIEAFNFHAAGACRRISAGHSPAVHQQLPAAVKPEFQHIWRTANRV